MLDNEVPQEGNSTLGGHRKAIYARGADGKLHIVQSAGWEVEEIVTRQAVEDLNRLAEDARQRIARSFHGGIQGYDGFEFLQRARRIALTLMDQRGLQQARRPAAKSRQI